MRTIWDGDQILWEIAAPGGSQSMDLEDDDYRQAFGGPYFDGRVQHTHAGVDVPVILTRIGYSEPLERPITIWPLTNWAGRFDSGEVVNGCVTVTIPGASGGTFAPYVPAPGEPGYGDDYYVIQHCVEPNWPGKQLWSSLRPKPGSPPRGWVGSLTQHGRDPSGQYYRRNRYYDPVAGRFTQEDPIGVAGGLNVYGYAEGDPVNQHDPFGLACERRGSDTLKCTNIGPGDFSTIRRFLGGASGESAYRTFAAVGWTQWNSSNCRGGWDFAECANLAEALARLTVSGDHACSAAGTRATRRFQAGRYQRSVGFLNFFQADGMAIGMLSPLSVGRYVLLNPAAMTYGEAYLTNVVAHEERHMRRPWTMIPPAGRLLFHVDPYRFGDACSES